MAVESALKALLHPFDAGVLDWPASGEMLFLGARAGVAFPAGLRDRIRCQQDFKPFEDGLRAEGFGVEAEAVDATGSGARHPLVLLLPSRQRDLARARMARALSAADEGGIVLACMANDEGARSGETDFRRLAGKVQSLSKHRCRVFWTHKEASAIDMGLLSEWRQADMPRRIADGRFLSRPGVFAWDRIDAASALLAAHLPSDVSGHGADLGAGYGYLSVELLARCPRIEALDLYEADARALALAEENLRGLPHPAKRGFLWHDVATGLSRRYDFIVSNPPFHQGKADLPELGRAFIAAAANALVPGGRLLLVANRHLPYEATLHDGFARVRLLADAQGFKVLEAMKSGA